MKRFIRTISLFFVLCLLVGSVIPNLFLPPQALALPQNFFTQDIASGFNEPTDFVETPDGSFLVIEKSGGIKLVKNGVVSNFTDAPLPVNFQGERGLLGITLDPNYASNRFIYIFYVNNSPLEYHVSRIKESGGKMAAGSEVVLYKTTTNPNGKTHLGGGLRFGGDGKLWFTIGDNTLNVEREPQKITSPYGKLHRINTDGSIPADNPFAGQSGAVGSIYALGLRNPFKFDFGNGKVYLADVGGDFWEEINIITKGGNYGWPDCEGACNTPGFINPIHQYGHGPNGASVTGGVVYDGNQFPQEYKNDYFFGDYVNGFIKRLDYDSNGNLVGEKSFDDNGGTVVGMRVGSDGSLYYLNIFPGVLKRIHYSTVNQTPVAVISANPTSGDAPLDVQFSSNGSFDYENSSLNYKWDFGDGGTSTEANPKHTYTNTGKFSAKLVVNDGQLDSPGVSQEIQVGNLAPEILDLKPQDGVKYNAGDTINFSANAKDREDGDLGASSYNWKIIFHHEGHTHPYAEFTGIKSGSFIINDNVERSADTFYEILLTVKDSSALQTTKTVNVYPNKVKLNISSNIPNMVVKLNGIPYATPYLTEAVVNFKLTLEAVSPLQRNGKDYEFSSWSDGGAQLHIATIPSTDLTLTANYKDITGGSKRVSKYSVVAGDIKVNGQPLYDNDGATGLAVLFEEEADIETPWGASVITNPDLQTAEVTLKQVAEDMKNRGCGSSCASVDIIYFPKDVPPPSYEMTAGETKTVAKNSVILGDVKVSGSALYDGDEKTGLIVILIEDAQILSEWGATVLGNKSLQDAQAKAQKFAEQFKQTGCGSGCSSVAVINWPN